ncbi:AAA family ATPase [Streptomyces sp. enrichment culture]|uniref:helix-turn-helix transcriptional regulator n=1 Tax=Streptomyces sp. enrichment culture TaxID=1795815 RepID=UPI003F56B359
MSVASGAPELWGRDEALSAVDALVRGITVTDAPSAHLGPEGHAAHRTLLVVGEPGIGKTSVLEAAGRRVRESGGQARWIVGRAEEAAIAFSGLDTLLHPLSRSLDDADPADRELIRSALQGGKQQAGGVLFLAGAVLRLWSRWAEKGHLLILVDDLQWLDPSTQDLLATCARRLDGEPVGLVLGARPTALPTSWERQATTVRLGHLDDVQAGRLLDSLPTPPKGRLRRQVLRQAAGNPLGLAELARSVARDGRESGPAGVDLPLTDRLENLFAQDLASLTPTARRLVLVAAVADLPDTAALAEILGDVLQPDPDEPTEPEAGEKGDESSVPQQSTAAVFAGRTRVLDVAEEAWARAEEAGLLVLRDGTVAFRHPLVRSAVLAAFPFDERARVHRLVASAPGLDADRRAWHLAAATVTPDEDVAAALESTADRARLRGGYAAAAMTLERSAQLSPRTEDRVRRLNAAAQSAMFGGHPKWVADLTAAVASLSDDEEARAEAHVHAGWALTVTSRHDEAMDRLLKAADAWAASDPGRCLEALGTAATVAYNSGDSRYRTTLLRRYRELPPHEPNAESAWILASCDPHGGRAEALRHLRHAASAQTVELRHWGPLGAAAWALDETDAAVQYYGTLLELFRQAPTSGGNATVASAHAIAQFEAGRWSAALSGLAEAERAASAGGLELAMVSVPLLSATLAAVRGDAERAVSVLAQGTRDFDLRGTLTFEVRARQARALAALADGDHQVAYFHLSRLFQPDGRPVHFHSSFHGLADLASSARRTGRTEEARTIVEGAVAQLPADLSPRLWLIVQRAHGVLEEDPARAEELLRAAAFTPGAELWPFERALSLAEFGEWLRRRHRNADARAPLTEALELFQTLGAVPWATRASAELRAAGVDRPDMPRRDATMELTSQQLAIVELAAQGLTNREIGERLFLSPRTVGFHLNRAFPKLGVTSRFQLRDVISSPKGHANAVE